MIRWIIVVDHCTDFRRHSLKAVIARAVLWMSPRQSFFFFRCLSEDISRQKDISTEKNFGPRPNVVETGGGGGAPRKTKNNNNKKKSYSSSTWKLRSAGQWALYCRCTFLIFKIVIGRSFEIHKSNFDLEYTVWNLEGYSRSWEQSQGFFFVERRRQIYQLQAT